MMASFKALCLAGVASLVATAAGAADLLPPPAPVYAPPPPPVVFGGGWYLRGGVGVGIADFQQNGSTFKKGTKIPGLRYERGNLTDTGFIDAGVGYQVNQWFRADITGEYRVASQYSSTLSYTNTACRVPGTCSPRGYDNYKANIGSITGLVNGYVDVGTWYGVTPYIGAGVGFSRIGFNNLADFGAGSAAGGFGYAGNNYQYNFAWAAMAGLSFAVTQNLRLELGYRYLDLGKIASGPIRCTNVPRGCPNEIQRASLAYNDIRLGFRYMFADAVPAFAPAPLIRKY